MKRKSLNHNCFLNQSELYAERNFPQPQEIITLIIILEILSKSKERRKESAKKKSEKFEVTIVLVFLCFFGNRVPRTCDLRCLMKRECFV